MLSFLKTRRYQLRYDDAVNDINAVRHYDQATFSVALCGVAVIAYFFFARSSRKSAHHCIIFRRSGRYWAWL
jgi:hypothetical protein